MSTKGIFAIVAIILGTIGVLLMLFNGISAWAIVGMALLMWGNNITLKKD